MQLMLPQNLKLWHSKVRLKGDIGITKIEGKNRKDAKLSTSLDQGIGMTEDEVKISQSSCPSHLQKNSWINTRMTLRLLDIWSWILLLWDWFADTVVVGTKSYQKDAQAVQWTCKGDPEYGGSYYKDQEELKLFCTSMVKMKNTLRGASHQISFGKSIISSFPVEIKFGTRTETSYGRRGDDKKRYLLKWMTSSKSTSIWKKSLQNFTDEEYFFFQ